MLSDLSENDSKMAHIEEGGKTTNKSTTAYRIPFNSRNSTHPSIITGKAATELQTIAKNHVK